MDLSKGDFVRWFDSDAQCMRYGRVTRVDGERVGFEDWDQKADLEWEATGQEREVPIAELTLILGDKPYFPSERGSLYAQRERVAGILGDVRENEGLETNRQVLIELDVVEATEAERQARAQEEEQPQEQQQVGGTDGGEEEEDAPTRAATLDEQTEAQEAPVERDISLSDRIGRIYRTFYDRFDDIWNGVEFYVKDVYAESLIAYARHEEAYYRVGYEWDEERGGADFDEPETWREVAQEWVDVDDGRTVEDLAEEKAALREGSSTLLVGDGQRGGIGSILATRRGPAAHVKQGRQQIRDGEPYYRDFAGWDPPHPQIRKSSDGQRLTVTVNTTDEDRHGTIILPTGARLERYNDGNPIVLINHDHTLPAATSSVGIRGEGLGADLQANVEEDDWDLDDPEIERWHRKVTRDNPIVRSASIGALFHEWMPGREFDGIEALLGREVRPNERLPRVITDWELLEWSFVSVPSNPSATVDARQLERRLQQSLIGLEQRLAQHQQQNQRQIAAATAAPESKPQEANASSAADEEVPAEAARSDETDSSQPASAEHADISAADTSAQGGHAKKDASEEMMSREEAQRLLREKEREVAQRRRANAEEQAKRRLGRA